MIRRLKQYFTHKSIQFSIAASFTLVSIACMGLMAVILFGRTSDKVEEKTITGNEQVLNQVCINLETYLRNMMRVSDSLYYSVIKNTDLSADKIDPEMALLYESNKDVLVSIACFGENGGLIGASPVANMKPEINPAQQEWFHMANVQMENLHFSTPHVQNLFDDSSYRYYWVVSLSRVVELTSGGTNRRGILLVDMNFSGIEQIFKRINSQMTDSYVYLMDNNGEIIYHPKQKLIYSGVFQESNSEIVQYSGDGTYYEEFQGEQRVVSVKMVGYTGWRIVSVTAKSALTNGMDNLKYFMIMVIMVAAGAVILINQFVSAHIARPIKELEKSVWGLENGNLDAEIYIGGSDEIKHLGNTLRTVAVQLKQVMEDMVKEQEEKRKSELDALQSQINPHFLYNTLDSIVWMIEVERYKEAIFMITELASLFRISLSKGKNIITIEEEITHAKNYLNIQQVRYKNKFSANFEIEQSIRSCATVKLVIQPLLENAIYYGMEYMDGEGEITVRGYRKEGDIYIEVTDNGLGMTEETVKFLLTDNTRIRRRGSGVGLINVHQRIRLRFGEPYGLEVESRPDEGTTVKIHLPEVHYEEGSSGNNG